MEEVPDTKSSLRLFDKYLRGTKNGFFVECGANTGIHRSIGYWFEKERKWNGINIECNPHCFEQLKTNRPNCVNLSFALSNKNSTATFSYPTEAPRKNLTGGGSIVYDNTHWGGKVDNCKVKTTTYSSFIKDYKIKHIDLFILDVEENEINVLMGISDATVLPRVFCIETNKIDKKQIIKILGPFGYKIRSGYASNTYFVR